MLHSDIVPEHNCNGDLMELGETEWLRKVRCSLCGTEFTALAQLLLSGMTVHRQYRFHPRPQTKPTKQTRENTVIHGASLGLELPTFAHSFRTRLGH
jgi:hypothetical protein